MRALVFALTAIAAAQGAAAQEACIAEKSGGQWQASAGSKSYGLSTTVFLTVPEDSKVRLAKPSPLTGYSYSLGASAELSYRSEGDIYFRLPALVVHDGQKWVSVAALLQSENRQLLVGFGEPGGGLFAYTALGDQMAGQLPTQFGILTSAQAAPLHERLESGKPFDIRILTNGGLFAEARTFTYPDFTAGKTAADTLFADLRAKAERGECL